jgi:hypothetical protein
MKYLIKYENYNYNESENKSGDISLEITQEQFDSLSIELYKILELIGISYSSSLTFSKRYKKDIFIINVNYNIAQIENSMLGILTNKYKTVYLLSSKFLDIIADDNISITKSDNITTSIENIIQNIIRKIIDNLSVSNDRVYIDGNSNTVCGFYKKMLIKYLESYLNFGEIKDDVYQYYYHYISNDPDFLNIIANIKEKNQYLFSKIKSENTEDATDLTKMGF